jgi:hypothetical protein
MKKILLACLSMLFVVLTFAQSKKISVQNDRTSNKIMNTTNFAPTILPLAAAAVAAPQQLWSDDFSDSANWVIDHDITACALDWQIGTPTCQGSYQISDILSTTASNGYAMIDSDFYGGATGGSEMEDCWLTTKYPIDLNGYPDVIVQFEAQYRSFNNEKAFVVIGIGDGQGNVTWPDLDASSGTTNGTPAVLPNNVFEAFPDYGSGDQTDNPELITVNITPALDGLSSTELADLYLRFHWTGTWGYAWFIDDVSISVTPDNKIKTKDVVVGGYWVDFANYSAGPLNDIVGLDYSVTPLSQIANHPFAIEAIVKNEGLSEQHIELSYNVTGAAVASGNSGICILTSQEDSALTTTLFSPSVIGNYSIDVMTVADSAGYGSTLTYTDTVTKLVEVSEYIYGKDLGIANANTSGSILGGPGDQWHYTTRYEMYANELLYSVRAYISGESVPGAVIKAIVYEVDTTAANDVSLYVQSDNYTITAQDLDSWINIPITDAFFNPVSLFSTYAYDVGLKGFQSSADSSFVGTSGESLYNGEHSLFDEFGLNPNTNGTPGTPTWYYSTRTPMIRLNFDPASATVTPPAGLEDLKSNISIYPNPSNGVFVIELDIDTKYDVNIYNVLGQTVYTTSTNSMITQVDLSSLDKGVYTIEIGGLKAVYKEKVVVE